MIEELAEEREPGVVRCREAEVGLHVVDLEDLLVVACAKYAVETGARDEGGAVLEHVVGDDAGLAEIVVQYAVQSGIDSCRIGSMVRGGLIDDEIANDARL